MSLIAADEPPVFQVVNSDGRAPLLLVADHAGRAIPRALGGLGVEPAAMEQHVAYDLGSAWLARALAQRLDAPAILHGYSRLVIDPNRRLDDPTSIVQVSDGVIVPGNRDLAPAAAAARAEACFWPYHQAIARTLDGFAARGVWPAVLAIHSFTRLMRGQERPWQVGVLWGDDGALAQPLIAALAAAGDIVVGDNEPYSAQQLEGYTMEAHVYPRRLPSAILEVRQDLLATEAAAAGWAERLARALRQVLPR